MFDFFEKLFALRAEKQLSSRDAGLTAWLFAGLFCVLPPILHSLFSGFLAFVIVVAFAVTMCFFVCDFLGFFAAPTRARLRSTFFDFISRQLGRTFSVEDSARFASRIHTRFTVLRDFRAERTKKLEFSFAVGAFLRQLGLAPSFPRTLVL